MLTLYLAGLLLTGAYVAADAMLSPLPRGFEELAPAEQLELTAAMAVGALGAVVIWPLSWSVRAWIWWRRRARQ